MTEVKKKEYRSDPTSPSNLFINSLQNGHGSPDMECGWCDRMHFCPTSDSYTRDEDGGKAWEEDCVKQHKENPEGVILHWDCDSVMGYMFNGINFVACCPCNGLTRYETFIWSERNSIRYFLKDRIELEHDRAMQELSANKLAGVSSTASDREKYWRGH